mmetsp:Transcript_35858/g.53442  ORF Transcript_35858/g.53442 Transcript_35858/m.53442 type:complete len:556 (-) Transcript_35858:108-1775(-)|eukprot:CAMPEP_0194049378 /NCGR_PEP_ID=MMETSP0009_2-20130614/30544_1 /TAXON_ID=210454 /ORGANISM="Grammatophora oceanica, Strain CCMP 410" /LENGTH=555 /DNA_ID=CAMNT_0038695519 /DNA_START=107 /DNA_END=1774 /DNA_ORIENTATION=+
MASKPSSNVDQGSILPSESNRADDESASVNFGDDDCRSVGFERVATECAFPDDHRRVMIRNDTHQAPPQSPDRTLETKQSISTAPETVHPEEGGPDTETERRQHGRHQVALEEDVERSHEFRIWFNKTWSGGVSCDHISALTSTVTPSYRAEVPEKRGRELRCRLLWGGALAAVCAGFLLIWLSGSLQSKSMNNASNSSAPTMSPSNLAWEDLLVFSPYHLSRSEDTALAFGGSDQIAVASTMNGGTVKIFKLEEQRATEIGLPLSLGVVDPDKIVVKMSEDGKRVAVATTSTTDLGSVQVFTYDHDSTSWLIEAQWKGNRQGDEFGSSMDMSSNGEMLVFVECLGTRARVYQFEADGSPRQMGPALFIDDYSEHTVVSVSEDLLGLGSMDGVQFYHYSEGKSNWDMVEAFDEGHFMGGPEHSVAPGGALALNQERTDVAVCGFLRPYGELLCHESIGLDKPVKADSYIGLSFEPGFDLDKIVLVQESMVSVFEYDFDAKSSRTWRWEQKGEPLPLDPTDAIPIVAVGTSEGGVMIASANFVGSMGSVTISRLSP